LKNWSSFPNLVFQNFNLELEEKEYVKVERQFRERKKIEIEKSYPYLTITYFTNKGKNSRFVIVGLLTKCEFLSLLAKYVLVKYVEEGK